MYVNVDASKIRLETNRLFLRAFKEEDIIDFYNYAKVPGVGEAAGWTHHKSIDESKKILDMFLKGNHTLALVYKATNKVIGSLGLEKPSVETPDKSVEFGFVLSKDYWNQGIMTEAVKSMINYTFNNLDVDCIFCGYFEENVKSKRVQEKCGFEFFKKINYHTLDNRDIKSIENVIYKEKA